MSKRYRAAGSLYRSVLRGSPSSGSQDVVLPAWIGAAEDLGISGTIAAANKSVNTLSTILIFTRGSFIFMGNEFQTFKAVGRTKI